MNKPLLKFEIPDHVPGIFVEVYPEECPDWSWAEDDNALMPKVKNGDVEQVCILIKIYDPSGHVEGNDSLGAVVVGNDAKQDVLNAIKDNGMVNEAKSDLKKKLREIKLWERTIRLGEKK